MLSLYEYITKENIMDDNFRQEIKDGLKEYLSVHDKTLNLLKKGYYELIGEGSVLDLSDKDDLTSVDYIDDDDTRTFGQVESISLDDENDFIFTIDDCGVEYGRIETYSLVNLLLELLDD